MEFVELNDCQICEEIAKQLYDANENLRILNKNYVYLQNKNSEIYQQLLSMNQKAREIEEEKIMQQEYIEKLEQECKRLEDQLKKKQDTKPIV